MCHAGKYHFSYQKLTYFQKSTAMHHNNVWQRDSLQFICIVFETHCIATYKIAMLCIQMHRNPMHRNPMQRKATHVNLISK